MSHCFSLLLSFFFSSRRRHTSCGRDWSSDVCSSDLPAGKKTALAPVKPTPGVAEKRSSLDLPEGEARVLSALLTEWPESAALAVRLPSEIFTHPIVKEILSA